MGNLFKKINPLRLLNVLIAKCFIALVIKAQECMQSPLQNSIMKTSAAFTLMGLFTANVYAQQASGGFAEMAGQAAEQATSIKEYAAKGFAAAGFCLAGVGGYNMWRKGKEGENSQVTAGKIFIPILAGAALGGIGFVMIKGGETVGINASQMGQLPY